MKISIKIKLILISVTFILMIITVMAGVSLYRERNLVRKSIIKEAEIQVTRLASNTANIWFSSDRDITFIDVMRNYSKIEDLLYLFILDNEQHIVTQTSKDFAKMDEKQRQVFQEHFIDGFPANNKERFLAYNDKAKPLVQEWRSQNIDILDFTLPIFHPIRRDEKIAYIRLGMSTARIDQQIMEATITISIITLILLAIGSLLGFIFGWNFSSPIQKLANHTMALGSGDFSLRINIKRRDELGELAKAINSMAESLEDGEKMKLDKARIDEQIELAREIQEGLNPSGFFNKEGLQVKGYTKAAKGIGGDYYDFIEVDEERVAILVSDVSGKDIPASLIMIMIRTVLNTLFQTNITLTPAILVRSVNRIMASDFAMDKFATMLFLMINRNTGELYFTNAGHNPVIIYRAELNRCTHIPLEGLPIGVDDESQYSMGRTFLKPGDITILYSDGVTEAWNDKKEEYQKARLLNKLMELKDEDAKTINEKIVADIWDFVGGAPQHDDTTLVIVKKT